MGSGGSGSRWWIDLLFVSYEYGLQFKWSLGDYF